MGPALDYDDDIGCVYRFTSYRTNKAYYDESESELVRLNGKDYRSTGMGS